MIFRHRRTRIEIEQTTVKVTNGDLNSVVPRPVTVPPAESVLARVLPFPATAPTAANAQPAVTTVPNPAAKENRP